MENVLNQDTKTNKLFKLSTLLLFCFGLGLNVLLSKVVALLGIPLFLDSIGTILVASLCGVLPGVAVGFLTNCINSIGDPISLYYGILNIFIAIIASELSRRGLFRKLWCAFLCVVVYAIIGGAIGSMMTWLLYGFSFGSGISAPFALKIYESTGISQFWSQFLADVVIDFADKAICVFAVFPFLLFLPKYFVDKFPYGYVYDKENKYTDYRKSFREKELTPRKYSLRIRIVGLIVGTALILSVVAVAIGLVIYRDKIEDRYESICESAVQLMLDEIDGDKVDVYFKGGAVEEYGQTKERLQVIFDAIADVKYMYVYKILDDGCHVIFDLDTPDLSGEDIGVIVEFDPTFEKYLPALLAGDEIEPIISDDQYGWLLTIYKPIKNSEGKCVAYAAADVDMHQLATDSYVFFIRVTALLFGASIIIITFALWYADSHIVEPINTLASQAKDFAYADEDERLSEAATWSRKLLTTGDELEVLSNAMNKTADEIVGYISEISKKAAVIEKMQINTINCFANMVESRDSTTGDHILRTAEYVRLLGVGLLKRGLYPDTIDSEYVKKLILSAPLHDIGKIGIPDTILNKPGKLTDDEFEIMKTHTTIGHNFILSSLTGIENGGYLNMASDMAEYHHEKWNGRGYPSGLAGDAIPLCARIMAIADVFDALLSKRSYKEPFTFEKAMSIIEEEAGKQFDPTLVEVFVLEQDSIRCAAR